MTWYLANARVIFISKNLSYNSWSIRRLARPNQPHAEEKLRSPGTMARQTCGGHGQWQPLQGVLIGCREIKAASI